MVLLQVYGGDNLGLTETNGHFLLNFFSAPATMCISQCTEATFPWHNQLSTNDVPAYFIGFFATT